MYQSVHSSDVDKRAEIGDAPNNTVIPGADHDTFPNFGCLLFAHHIEKSASGTGNAKSALIRIILGNQNFQRFTAIGVQIVNGYQIQLRAVNININASVIGDYAVLNDIGDLNGDRDSVLISLFDLCLVLAEVDMSLGQ